MKVLSNAVFFWLFDAIGDQDQIHYRTQVQFHVPRKSYHKSMSMWFIDKTNNDKQNFNPIFHLELC